MPKLIVNAGTSQAREYELKPGANFVGRGFANDIQLDDPSVSSTHAQIILTGSTVTVKDLGSTNGTFINRSPIKEAVLESGQYLRLGGFEVLFQADSATAPSANPTRPQPVVASPIVGEFRMSGPAIVAGRPTEFFTSQAAQAAAPAASSPAPAPAVVESPIKGMKLTGPAASAPTAAGPVAVISAPPIPVRVPAVPAQPVATPSVARAVVAAPVPVQATPAAVAEPPVAPPIPGGMVEPPEGKTACKYHPNNPGHWLCQTCTGLFCSLCVSSRRTNEGTGYYCRSCGTQCVPVKVKFVPKKEKGPKHYSDVTVLVRAIGFGCAGAVVAAAIWAAVGGIVGAVTLFMPGILCGITGVVCGYGVKIGSQDRPGIIFSLIAVGAMCLGIALGETAVSLITHFPMAVGMYGLFGLMFGGFTAWRIGGGDF